MYTYIICIVDHQSSKEADLSIIWLDATARDPSLIFEIGKVQEELRSTIDKNLKFFDDDEQCESFIRSQPLVKNVILIVDDKTAEYMINRVPYLCQIICAFVVQTASTNETRPKQAHLTKVIIFYRNL